MSYAENGEDYKLPNKKITNWNTLNNIMEVNRDMGKETKKENWLKVVLLQPNIYSSKSKHTCHRITCLEKQVKLKQGIGGYEAQA